MYASEWFGARRKIKVVELVGFIGVRDYYADFFLQFLLDSALGFLRQLSGIAQRQAYV
jgi:hypothetical protein